MDDFFERYKGNINLSLIGKENQEILKRKTVLVIGAGALGSSILTLLARNGINFGIVDADVVKKENIIRQILYDEEDIGKKKVEAAKEKLSRINKTIRIDTYDLYFDETDYEISEKYDVLVGATDNMKSRLIINEASVIFNIPWIYSAVEGSSAVLKPVIPGKTSCLRCFYKGSISEEKHNVLNTSPFAIAAFSVNIIIKILLNREIDDAIYYIDTWTMDFRKIELKRDENCRICSKRDYEFIKI